MSELRVCEFCKCKTNAKIRRCCESGNQQDFPAATTRQEKLIDCTRRLVFETRRLGGVWNPVACEMMDLLSEAELLTTSEEESERVLRGGK